MSRVSVVETSELLISKYLRHGKTPKTMGREYVVMIKPGPYDLDK
jgi:hypothetical protein